MRFNGPDRKNYVHNVTLNADEETNHLIARALASEVMGKVKPGFAANTYKTFWKKLHDDHIIYYLNYGHYV